LRVGYLVRIRHRRLMRQLRNSLFVGQLRARSAQMAEIGQRPVAYWIRCWWLHVWVLRLARIAVLHVKLLLLLLLLVLLLLLSLGLCLMLCKQLLLLLESEVLVSKGRRVYVGRNVSDSVLVLLLRIPLQCLLIGRGKVLVDFSDAHQR
jgi:hypothetical protein